MSKLQQVILRWASRSQIVQCTAVEPHVGQAAAEGADLAGTDVAVAQWGAKAGHGSACSVLACPRPVNCCALSESSAADCLYAETFPLQYHNSRGRMYASSDWTQWILPMTAQKEIQSWAQYP